MDSTKKENLTAQLLKDVNIYILIFLAELDVTPYFKAVRDTFSNKCHTANRATCYSVEAKVQSAATVKKFETTEKHLYYGCDDCVKKMVGGASGYLFVSSIFALFALLF